MSFTYTTEIKEREQAIIEDGEYNFETAAAYDHASKSSGKEMLTLELHMYDNNGKMFKVFDYIVDKTVFKLKDYWECVGDPKMFCGKNELHDFIGLTGRARIKVESREKDGSIYRTARVVEYIKPGSKQIEEFDDDIGF